MDERERPAVESRGVSGHELDIVDACFLRIGAREINHERIEVDRDDAARRSDRAAYVERDMAASGPSVQASIAALKARAFKEPSVVARIASESRSRRSLPSFPPAIA